MLSKDEDAGDAFFLFNPNPRTSDPTNKADCVVRAICAAFNWNWERAYAALSIQGFADGDNFGLDNVWGNFLERHGWTWHRIPDTCPRCYTLLDFAADHPDGTWIVGTGSHAVCVQNGVIFDSWFSGGVVPLFAWQSPDVKEA